MNRRLLIAVLAVIVIGGALWSFTIVQEPDTGGDAEQTVRSVVTEFGAQLQEVSLPESSDEVTYSDPAAAFRIAYPRNTYTVFGPGQEELARSGHYIPPCEDGFAACIAYTADSFTGTNFGSAGVGIFVVDAATRQACEATKYGALRQDVRSESIRGHEFTVFESGTAAMSHAANDTVYLTWHDEKCYQLVTRIASSRFEVYEAGTIEKFTDEAMNGLRDDLHAVVSTFELRP